MMFTGLWFASIYSYIVTSFNSGQITNEIIARPSVVDIMCHVDHGKMSFLEAICTIEKQLPLLYEVDVWIDASAGDEGCECGL